MNNIESKNKCICCDSNNLSLLLDLNEQPLANSYHDNTEELDKYPLGVNLCNDCYHIQLTHIVNPDLLFKDYLYVSGTTKTLRDNFEWFSKFVLDYVPGTVKDVLDIACNDGSQLDCFKSKDINTYGIDPAENLYELSSKNHNIKCDYFDSKLYKEGWPLEGYRTFDIIIAQNVFAHNNNPKKFLDDCCNIMHDNSYLFIQTSQAEMILNSQFDTIYHEHISFFNVKSFNELTKRTELNLVDVIKTPVHGISYLFILNKKNLSKYRVNNIIDIEKIRGLYSPEIYEMYKLNIINIVKEFKKEVGNYKNRFDYKIVGYGAAAKGMTFLNFANVRLDVVIDDNKLKQGLYTPGTNIPIRPNKFLKQYKDDDKILFVPLAWNFYNEIKERILNTRNNNNDRFLKYFPIIKVEE